MPDHAPVRRTRGPRPLTVVLRALAGVAAGVVLFLVVLAVAGPKSTKQAAGASFKVGSAKRLAPLVAKDGPLLFQDPLNRSRDIFVQHLGGDEWRAFEAHAPGAPRACVLEWRRDQQRFLDPCNGRAYPPDGAGLTAYPARVDEKGAVVVDLRTPAAPPTTAGVS